MNYITTISNTIKINGTAKSIQIGGIKISEEIHIELVVSNYHNDDAVVILIRSPQQEEYVLVLSGSTAEALYKALGNCINLKHSKP